MLWDDCGSSSVQKIEDCCDEIAKYIVCVRQDGEKNTLIVTINVKDGLNIYRLCYDCLMTAFRGQIEGGIIEKFSNDSIIRLPLKPDVDIEYIKDIFAKHQIMLCEL